MNPNPSESDEQKALFEWAALGQYPDLALMYHIPNGGLRSKATASKLKAEGVKPGVPDICLPVPRKGYHALYIELKRRYGGRVSADQRFWIDELNLQGNFAVVCQGWSEARKVIEYYLREV